ncbi:MAG: hypothetical protein JNJ58_10780 [Chitinophagaceae bacterium]|nr:hypothetical protein [Chitinophagaceae bacterium]
MKLEQKKQKVAPFKQFLKRVARYAGVAMLLILFSVVIGQLGYHYIADVSWIDSFHMSCLILTGMGPVVEMKTNAAKIFSSLFALYSGVAFLSSTAVFFSPIIHRLLHILHVDDESNSD